MQCPHVPHEGGPVPLITVYDLSTGGLMRKKERKQEKRNEGWE